MTTGRVNNSARLESGMPVSDTTDAASAGNLNIADGIRIEALYGDRLVPCYADRPRNLDDMLVRVTARVGNGPAVQDGLRSLSYFELDQQANRVATGLIAQGVVRGDRVAVFVGNRLEFIVLMFGIWRLGAVAVPIGTRQSAAELGYMLNQCGAVALVYDAPLQERLPAAADMSGVRLLVRLDAAGEMPASAITAGPVTKSVQTTQPIPAVKNMVTQGKHDASDAHTHTDITWNTLLASGADVRHRPAINDQAPACIMYTSGTTGHPKGAVLSHLGFFHTARHYERRFGYGANERMLLVIPASHISGLLAAIVVTAQVGGCVVSMPQFKPADVLDEIESRRITAAIMVPSMYNLLLLQPDLQTRDLSSWRIGHFGGAAMPEVTIQRLAQTWPGLALYNGFGATETTSAVTLTERGGAAQWPDTVGTTVPCVDIRVLDQAGCEVATGESGELWIRSPGNAISYWNNPEATRAGFVAGYWRSGDIGSVDAQGHLRVFDRIKDMINRGGYKVYCVELENIIQRHPGVIEVAAVPSPCPVLGERIHVFIHAHQPVDTEAVRALCRRSLADYKVPDFVTLCDTPLPRNLNGKLVKASLRDIARGQAHVLHATREHATTPSPTR
ncbi:MAG: long-chain fatty acid--CoA ligase [Comamonadaceae bacterium]|nr:MAG: long-chain fatty acid--CoA ligase [Comamonadaceae bacterium]